MRKLAIFTTMTLALASMARADIQVSLVTTPVQPTPDGSNFDWAWDATLTAGYELESGDYFTIYDIGGFISALTPPANWSIVTTATGDGLGTAGSHLVGVTPASQNVTDDPTIPNMTWVYTGPNEIANGSNLDLGNFTILSSQSGALTFIGTFTGYSQNASLGTSGGNNNSVIVPGVAPTGTPEPATFLLFGGGLTAFGILRWRRRA